jgi:hypothetical protein
MNGKLWKVENYRELLAITIFFIVVAALTMTALFIFFFQYWR